MKRFKSKLNVFRFICFVAYILCAVVLIVESCLNGEASSSQSNIVGGSLADIFNDLSGDQTKVVQPTQLNIENKKAIVNVGDSYQLNIKILPEDATYQSVIYSSSNENIATISNEGIVKFIQQGEVTLSAINAKYTTIKDCFNVEVKNVEATDIECFILNAEKKENNVYAVYLSKTDYYIHTNIIPENTTFKKITYSTNKEDFLTISESGKITPLQYSKNEITEITINVGKIKKILSVIIEMDIIPLENIVLDQYNYEIYPTQIVTPKISFYPNNATFKEYQLISSNPSIVTITSSSFKGVKAGTAKITIQSMEYENVKAEINLTVLSQPDLMDFKASFVSSVYVGTSNKININDIQPKYANTSSIVYESLNPAIAEVDSKGNVKAISAGMTTINIKDKKQIFSEKQVTVKVIERDSTNLDYTTDFDIGYLQGQQPVIYTNQEIDLKDYFEVSKFYCVEGHETTNKEMVYSLADSYQNKATLTQSLLKVNLPGEIQIHITHKASNITKSVTLIALDDFTIEFIHYESMIQEMIVGNSLQLTIKDEINALQTYLVQLDNSKIASLSKMNDYDYTLTALTNGEVYLSFIPCYDNVPYIELKKDLIIQINHRYISYIDFLVYNQKTKEDIVLTNNHFEMFMNDSMLIKPTVDPLSTIHEFVFESSREDILSISAKGELIPHKTGEVQISLKDKYTNLEQTFNVKIRNKVVLDSENNIIFKGNDAQYDASTNTYSLTNGYSGSIMLNFSKESTYKEVIYSSSNENIISIGKDGKLSPNKEGKAVLTLTCDDGMSSPIIIQVNVEVKRQNVIKDINSFLLKVRKSLGHFGAFMILGVFSTLAYMLYWDKKKWFFSIPINFAMGFGLGVLTEFIQTFVPGRSGLYSDVIIDFSGFLCSSLFITLLILSIYTIHYFKRKKSQSINEK